MPIKSEVLSWVQFSSVTQSCPTLCDPMNHRMPGLPVHHQLPESTQTHVHPTISSSVIPFSSCSQSFSAWGSYLINSFLTDIKQFAKTSGVSREEALSVPLLMSMSEAFSVPFYTLIKLCYTKAFEWSRLVPGPKAKSSEVTNPTPFPVSYQY